MLCLVCHYTLLDIEAVRVGVEVKFGLIFDFEV